MGIINFFLAITTFTNELPDAAIKEAIKFLKAAQQDNIFVCIAQGQLSEVLEKIRTKFHLQSARKYFQKAYQTRQEIKAIKQTEEPRAKLVYYTCLAVSEAGLGFLDLAFETSERIQNDYLVSVRK